MRETDRHTEDWSSVYWWRLVLQLGLILAAGLFLLVRPHMVSAIRNNELAPEWLFVGPAIFLALFLACFALDIFAKTEYERTALDYIQLAFGIVVIVLSFPSSLREYNVRRSPDATSINLIEKFARNRDASIRALAILAASRHNLNNPSVGALIHKGLLDKDPLVQQAAKLVIEDNFGIRLRNGAEGIHQAQTFIQDVGPSASLMRKGSP